MIGVPDSPSGLLAVHRARQGDSVGTVVEMMMYDRLSPEVAMLWEAPNPGIIDDG